MTQPHTTYLNHAGTSWPKPAPVTAAANAFSSLDPTQWQHAFDEAHHTVADFFHVEPDRLLLTPSCTTALSLGVLDHDWQTGDRIVTSHHEHHALQRTVVKLQDQGIEAETLPSTADELIDLTALRTILKAGRVRLLALTAASNVTGQLLPIEGAIALAHEHGTKVLIDGAQVAGWWDLDVPKLGADLFTFAGHKGPQAPWGIAGLYVSPDVVMKSPAAVCEGAVFAQPIACAVMPGYCDAGSVNVSALVGLATGCRWLSEPTRSDRLNRARQLARQFTEAIRPIPGLKIHGDVSIDTKMPTVALTIGDSLATELAGRLREQGVIVSGGFQCAPQAHTALGTSETGVLRVSFGPESQPSDAEHAAQALTQAAEDMPRS